MLTFKQKTETDTEKPHIDVYRNKVYIGYIMKQPSLGAKWHFWEDNVGVHIPTFSANTKRD
jgi:hypothetical protein